MKIAIATDHNGVNEKKEIMNIMKDVEFVDYSTNNYDTDDYPDFAFKVAEDVAKGIVDLGVLMCGTGIGMSIAANKVKGVLCGHCSSVEQAHLAKEHNHASIIALSYKQPVPELVEMIREFIKTEPSKEERHNRRVNKILDYEKAR